jgi:hypothetical protein
MLSKLLVQTQEFQSWPASKDRPASTSHNLVCVDMSQPADARMTETISYRYAWAERAKTCGYPERFAQEALGHNSKAVHRAYAKRALMKIPSLEDYEKRAA